MSPVLFFRLSLLVPVLLPIIMLFTGPEGPAAFFMFALMFGGPAYLFLALLMYGWIGRRQSIRGIRRLVYLSPIIFVPIEAVFVTLLMLLVDNNNIDVVEMAKSIVMFSGFSLLVGYIYVVLVNLTSIALEWCGWLSEEESGNCT